MIAKEVDQVTFRGMFLRVVEYKDDLFIPLSPIAHLLGFDVNTLELTIFNGENKPIFQPVQLSVLTMDGHVSPSINPENISTEKKEGSNFPIFIKIQMVFYFISKYGEISNLTSLLDGWHEVYTQIFAKNMLTSNKVETTNINFSQIKDISNLLDVLNKAVDSKHYDAITKIIDKYLLSLGVEVKRPTEDKD